MSVNWPNTHRKRHRNALWHFCDTSRSAQDLHCDLCWPNQGSRLSYQFFFLSPTPIIIWTSTVSPLKYHQALQRHQVLEASILHRTFLNLNHTFNMLPFRFLTLPVHLSDFLLRIQGEFCWSSKDVHFFLFVKKNPYILLLRLGILFHPLKVDSFQGVNRC